MTRTQIQLPDELYRKAKALAADREISLAELVRHGLEHMLTALTPPTDAREDGSLPILETLPETPDFAYPQWKPDGGWSAAADGVAAKRAKKKGARA